MIERKEPKNLHAVNLLRSWLDALDIENRPGNDIIIETASGDLAEVKVAVELTDMTTDDVIIVKAKDLTGSDISKAKGIFRELVESLGYNYTDPADRGELPDGRISSKKDFESVYLRHSDIRRSPNPSTERLLAYSSIVNKAAKAVYNKNQWWLSINGVDLEDLKSIAMTHIVTYLSQYKVPEGMDKEDNNVRKCYVFLKQRLGLYLSMLDKKSTATVIPATMWAGYLSMETFDDVVDVDYIKRNNKFTSKNKLKRKEEAKIMLDNELAKLPHEDMIYVLDLAINSDVIDPSAAKLAEKILDEHRSQCQECLLTHKSEESSAVNLRG